MKAQQKATIRGFLLRSELPLSDIRRLQDSESLFLPSWIVEQACLSRLDERLPLAVISGITNASYFGQVAVGEAMLRAPPAADRAEEQR
jgi:hypothetical protein